MSMYMHAFYKNAHDKQVKYMLCIHAVAIFFKEKLLFDVLFKSNCLWWVAGITNLGSY